MGEHFMFGALYMNYFSQSNSGVMGHVLRIGNVTHVMSYT
jgi:hypothetical protein